MKNFLAAICAACLTACLLVTGCGGEEKPSEPATKTETDAPQFGADKAVLAYAQLYAYGIIEDENLQAAGLTQAGVEEIQNQVLQPVVDALQKFPLNDESVSEMAKQYVGKLHKRMAMKTRVKTDDPKNPVVELTAATIDGEEATRLAQDDENLTALAAQLNELQAAGMTEDDLKANEDFQQFAMESLNAYIDDFPFNDEQSIDVPCEATKASDGKFYWAPKDRDAVIKFVTGQK